jgi:hypothetical protein
MKLIQKISLLALVLGNGSLAVAQSNSTAGDTDYAKFSQFISDRNIFDPERTPHSPSRPRSPRPRPSRSNAAPTFTLVGAMSYEKGMFAFFSGNTDDVKKILTLNGDIAGYAVTEITLNAVKLTGADKKEIILRVGDQMRRENNGWELVEQGDAPAGSGRSGNSAAGGDSANSTGSGAATDSVAPSASVSGNDVLKRLMQQREQENK